MPYWTLTLSYPEVDPSCTIEQSVHPGLLTSIYVEGVPAKPDTWRFLQFFDETQVTKRDWLCQFDFSFDMQHLLTIHLEFKAGGVSVSTELPDTFIKSPSAVGNIDQRVELPCSLEPRWYFAVLRNGDTIEFENQKVSIHATFNPDDQESKSHKDSNIEVTSSRPLVVEIKDESRSSDVETDDEENFDGFCSKFVAAATAADESQHLYSTSRENQSPTPRAQTVDSQIVKETPSRKRNRRSQQESAVFDSMRMPTMSGHVHPDQQDTAPASDVHPNRPSFHEIPSIASNDLPDTLPNSYPDLYSEPIATGDGNTSTNENVERLIRNLNESSEPPSDAKPSKKSFTEVKNTRPSDDVVPAEPEETNGALPHEPNEVSRRSSSGSSTRSPSRSPTGELARSAIDDHNEPGAQATIRVADRTPSSSAASNRPTPGGTSVTVAKRSGKKRKLQDAGSVGKTTKHTKLNDEYDSINGNPSLAATPASADSRRSSSRIKGLDDETASPSSRRYSGPPPKILFSNTSVPDRDGLMRFLRGEKATTTEVTTAKGSNFLCVGKGELKTTAKLLHSLTQGKTIVTDDWVVQSSKEKFLLHPAGFLPDALKETADLDRSQIFSGQVVYVTPDLRLYYGKGWDDIQAIIRQAGGLQVLTGPLSKMKKPEEITMYIGCEGVDSVAAELQKSGQQLYKKDIIGASVVQGKLLTKDEGLVLPPALSSCQDAEKPDKQKKGRRKK